MGARVLSEPIVAAHGLAKLIGGRAILRDVSATVSPGSVVGVLGKTGAGKTTLLEVLLGFSPASSGTARLWSHDSFDLPSSLKARIGYVPQHDELAGMLTGAQQIALNAALYPNWDSALIERLTTQWQVPMDRRIRVLSTGERQKLAVLLALGHQPDLVVLDEPLASLDPLARRSLLQHLLEITSEQSRAVIFSSHIVSDLERIADQVWILRNGSMAWQGELDTLKETVVRLHLQADAVLPERLDLPHTLRQRVDGNHAIISVSAWDSGLIRTLQEKFAARVEVEHLGLEEIFLELHD